MRSPAVILEWTTTFSSYLTRISDVIDHFFTPFNPGGDIKLLPFLCSAVLIMQLNSVEEFTEVSQRVSEDL